MNDPKNKKKLISTKTKIKIYAVLAILFFLVALYLGMRFQIFLTRFMINSYFGLVKFIFWAVLIVGIVLAVYVFYLVRKFKKRHDSGEKHNMK